MARNGNDNLIKFPNANAATGSETSNWKSALIDLSYESIFVWDWNDGIIIEWNTGAEKLYGHKRQETLGKVCHELLATKHPVSLRRFLKNLVADGHWAGELRHTTKDGREIIVESRHQVLLQDGRKIVLESNRDITDRRAGEGQIALLIIIGELISKMNKPADLLYATAKAVGEYFKAKRCLFNEIDLEKNLEVVHRDYFARGVKSVAGKHKLSAYSPAASAEMQAGRTVVNVDSKLDPRTAKLYRKTYEPAGERSYVAVPLMHEGQWKASLWISDDKPRAWTNAEVALLEVVAERAWLAVEKRRSEDELRASRAELDLIITGTPFMLTHCSRDLRYKYVSRSYAEMLGRQPAELVDKPIVEIMGKQALATIRPWIEKVLRGEPVEYEAEMPLLGGDSRHLRVSYVPERDVNNKVIGWIASIIDISERIRTDKALRESEESYRVLAESASDAIIRIDEYSIIRFVNTAATRVFGYTEKEMTGQPLTMLMPENLRDAHRAGFSRYLATGVRKLNWEGIQIAACHRDGRQFPIEISFGEYSRDGKRFFIGVARDITDRLKAVEDLRESEARRQLAQDAGNIGIFDWDIVADKTYWSETMWSFYGEEAATDVNPDDAYWSAHIHELDRERVKRNLRRVVDSGGVEFRDEFRIVRSDGSIRWIEARAKVSRDKSGKATRMYGVNTDITVRKETEEKIRASDSQLRLVTSSVPALIAYVDRDERFRFANERFTDWFGVPTEDVLGKQPKDIFGPAAYEVLKPWIDRALSGKKCTFETSLTYKTFGEKFVSVSYIPDIGADGTVYGYYALTHDITDLKHSEDLLRSSEERIGLLTDSFTDYAIFSMDASGLILNWNKGAEFIFGYPADEVIGRSYDIVFTAEDAASQLFADEMKNCRAKGRSYYEGWRLRKDGSQFYASAVMMPLYVGKTLIGYAKIVHDATAKKLEAQQLQEAHDQLEALVKERTKALSETNSALLDEMREREKAEKHRVDLLARLVTSQEAERRRFARDLHDQMGQRLTALRLKIASLHELAPGEEEFTTRVNRLQEIAQGIDSEVSFLAWELRPAALDDLGLVDACEAFVNEWSRHHDVAAEFHSSGLAKKRLDREVETHLYRITQEALNNIAKHAEAKQVTVMLERREQNVMLIIEDDGKGFDARQKRVASESGSGLGLLGMGERAALSGGDIEIESEVGRGTTIFVRVPFSK